MIIRQYLRGYTLTRLSQGLAGRQDHSPDRSSEFESVKDGAGEGCHRAQSELGEQSHVTQGRVQCPALGNLGR